MAAEGQGRQVDAEDPPAAAKSEVSADPNFAVVCAFVERFGASCGVQCPNIGDLQDMLESKGEVRHEWIIFQVKLLRKLKKSVSTDKWERALVKFAHSYSATDGWELERFGYRQAKTAVKLRLLKNLVEAQFDVNPKFKQEVNQKAASDLRAQPIGRDRLGNAYWFQSDDAANLRVYKEDPDEETWELVAQTRDELEGLVKQLKNGDVFVRKKEEERECIEEEDDSLMDYANVLRDTGPVPISGDASNVTSVAPSADNSDDDESKKESSPPVHDKSRELKDAGVAKEKGIPTTTYPEPTVKREESASQKGVLPSPTKGASEKSQVIFSTRDEKLGGETSQAEVEVRETKKPLEEKMLSTKKETDEIGGETPEIQSKKPESDKTDKSPEKVDSKDSDEAEKGTAKNETAAEPALTDKLKPIGEESSSAVTVEDEAAVPEKEAAAPEKEAAAPEKEAAAGSEKALIPKGMSSPKDPSPPSAEENPAVSDDSKVTPGEGKINKKVSSNPPPGFSIDSIVGGKSNQDKKKNVLPKSEIKDAERVATDSRAQTEPHTHNDGTSPTEDNSVLTNDSNKRLEESKHDVNASEPPQVNSERATSDKSVTDTSTKKRPPLHSIARLIADDPTKETNPELTKGPSDIPEKQVDVPQSSIKRAHPDGVVGKDDDPAKRAKLEEKDAGKAATAAATEAITEVVTCAVTKAETGAETGAVTKAETGAVTGAETGAVTKAETGAVTKAETGAETGAVTKAETGAETGAVTKAETGPETGAVTKAETGPVTGAVTEAVTEPTLVVEGRGSGAENNGANSRDGDEEFLGPGESIEEPTLFVFGRGSGAECEARNTQVATASSSNGKSNGVEQQSEEGEEQDLAQDVPAVPVTKSDDGVKGEDADNGSEEEENSNSNSRGQKRGRKGKRSPKQEASDEGEEKDEKEPEEEEESPKKKSRRSSKAANEEKKAAEGEEDETFASSAFRTSRRTSGRIAALRIREAERRQREEEEALQQYKIEQEKQSERERRRMEKYRALGLDYEKEMAKRAARKEKKRKKKLSDEDYSAGEAEKDDGGEKKRRRRRKKKKKKQRGDLKEFERFSSGSDDDEGLEGEDDLEDEDEHFRLGHDDDEDLFKSDHEFSCESDVPDDEAQPIKHARTATKKKKTGRSRAAIKKKIESSSEEEVEEEEDEDFACKKCDKSDHPEWILLCDKCDAGWHASCLRPSLMVIPEGSWYCPDCQHAELVERLEENLKSFEAVLKKRDADTKRKERLAFVSLSLSNMLPVSNSRSERRERVKKVKTKFNDGDDDESSMSGSDSSNSGSEGGSSSSGSSSSNEEDKDIGFTRRRAARNVTYTMREYDEMIKSAIADEEEEVRGAGNDGHGKDINTIIKASKEAEEKEAEGEEIEKSAIGMSGAGMGKDMSNIINAGEEEEEDETIDEEDKRSQDEQDDGDADDEIKPKPLVMSIQKDIGKKKKKKKLNELTDSESGDGDSGSDFHASEEGGTSAEEEDDDLEFELEDEDDDDDEDDKPRRRAHREPTRRSNRQRRVLYDDDFVIDGSGSEDEDKEEEESDDGEIYGRRTKKKSSAKRNKKKKKKRGRNAYDSEDSDFESKAVKRRKKILAEAASGRRTRGKKISFNAEDLDSEDSLIEEEKRKRQQQHSAARGRKKKDDTTSEEEFDEGMLDDKSEEDDDEFIDDD